MSGLHYDELNIHCPLPSMQKGLLTQSQIWQYAKASGDSNPIHIDDSAAKNAGLDGTIAHGMLVMGLLGEMISTWAGIQNIKTYRVRFKGVAKPGDILTSRGEIVKKYVSGNDKIIECKVLVENQRKEIIVDGSAAIRCQD
ncbi:MAG: hypothetical protein C4519_27810 [Desulfobacteraceae bacterium]|nr:MAG: hypothetical protein C4519_27810 [Desulfobacteraceae bacterium]